MAKKNEGVKKNLLGIPFWVWLVGGGIAVYLWMKKSAAPSVITGGVVTPAPLPPMPPQSEFYEPPITQQKFGQICSETGAILSDPNTCIGVEYPDLGPGRHVLKFSNGRVYDMTTNQWLLDL